MKLSIQQVVKDQSSLVLFKVRLKTLAKKLGFNSLSIENMQIVASEMLSNQIKYSNKTGMVQLWFHDDRGNNQRKEDKKTKKQTLSPVTIDIFAMDYGPGIKNVSQAYEDGYTTSRTMGKGLGSVKRMAHESELYTATDQKGWHGVALWARFYLEEKALPKAYQYGAFNHSYHGIAHNGDDLWFNLDHQNFSCLHLDATGHGQKAEEIVKKVREMNTNVHNLNVERMLDITQKTLINSTGAAVIALKYNADSGQGQYSAVGDMRLFIISDIVDKIPASGKLKDLKISSGILGSASRSYDRQEFKLNTNELAFSTSDGIRRNWTLHDFPNLWGKHPQLICFFLGNSKGRNSDDQSIIAVKRL